MMSCEWVWGYCGWVSLAIDSTYRSILGLGVAVDGK